MEMKDKRKDEANCRGEGAAEDSGTRKDGSRYNIINGTTVSPSHIRV